MLRSAIVSSPFIARRPLALASPACRAAFSTTRRVSGPTLHSDNSAGKSEEGKHPKDTATALKGPIHPKGTHASSGEGDKFPAPMTGDWVLFHPVYTKEEMDSVKVITRESRTISDRAASGLVRLLRFGFDLLSGYRHKEIPPNTSMTLQELREKGYVMDQHQWLLRILFLETVAGVPGMVAAMLRHLRSLRLMRRDAGWIHTLLEESENERMHLMTFMTLKKPSIWFRALVLGAQGVFFNAFFLGYLISPKTAHRFVGKLEEEAVYTYTHLIDDLEKGHLPEWENAAAPDIAIDYWRLPKDSKLVDVIRAVRADEATHRFVNHSLANLDQTKDVNPFAIREPDMKLKGTKVGLERPEAAEFVLETRSMLGKKDAAPAAESALEKPAP